MIYSDEDEYYTFNDLSKTNTTKVKLNIDEKDLESGYETVEASFSSWFLTFTLLLLPIINIIYLVGLVIGKSKYRAKVNFARGFLAFICVIVIVISALKLLNVDVFDSLSKLFENIKYLF